MISEETKACFHLVLTDLSEGIAADRCRQSFINSVEDCDNLSEDALKLIKFTETTFAIRLALCVNRLMQGDSKATLRRLVALVRPSLSQQRASELDGLLDKLLVQKNAALLKKCRDNFIAHTSLDVAARAGMPTKDVADLLYEVIEFIESFKCITGIRAMDALDPDTVLADWYNRADSVWRNLLPSVIEDAE